MGPTDVGQHIRSSNAVLAGYRMQQVHAIVLCVDRRIAQLAYGSNTIPRREAIRGYLSYFFRISRAEAQNAPMTTLSCARP